MSDILREHLSCLYGIEKSVIVWQELETLMGKWRTELGRAAGPASRAELGLTSRDSLLITYADQLRSGDVDPLAVLGEFARKHLKGAVTGIHLLPFYPWSSDDGFSVKDYYAVDPAAGNWDEVSALGRDFALMFDAVFNHMSAQSEWFQRFLAGDPHYQDFFVTVEGDPDLTRVVRPRALPLLTEFGRKKVWTTFSADQVDLNIANPAVLLALLDVLLFYTSRGARFIRLDAIAFLCKDIATNCLHLPATHRVIQLMRAVLDEVAPEVLLITETNVPHADNVSYFGDGTNEAQMVYNFALPPLVLHSLATGNAERLVGWAKTLGLPSEQVTYFNFLASHDGIGLNPARGILSADEIDALVQRTLRHGGFISWKHNPDGSRSPYEMNINYFDALSDPSADETMETQVARFACAHAILLALQGMPGLYFHSLFGSRGDRAGAESSGIPRRINRQKLDRSDIEKEMLASGSLRQEVFVQLKRLLQARGAEPAFDPAARQEVVELDRRVFCLVRHSRENNRRVVCIHNVSNTTVRLPPNDLIPSTRDNPTDLIHGTRRVLGEDGALIMAPYEVRWMASP
jgi:glucosylglycerate phosphorylase